MAELLPRLTWHMDEPTADPAIITAYLVCREARKQATVLLSGVGGDELFAGYRKHAAHRWARAYQTNAWRAACGIESGLDALPSLRGTAMKGSVRLAKKMARSASLEPEDRFIRNCTYLDAAQKMSLYTPEVQDQLRYSDPAARHHSSFRRSARRRFPEPDALSRHQDFHGQSESELQRQDEHGVVGRSARSVSRS